MMRKTILLMLLAIQTLACSGGEASAVEPSAGSGNTSQGSGSDQEQDSDPTPDPETTFYVSSADELKALGTLKPGTVVVWRNGLYSDQIAELKSAGTAEQPVILRAEKAGAVCFTGTSRISVSGTCAEVEGFWWRNPEPVSGKSVVTLAKGSSHCTVRDCAITGDNTQEDAETDTKWVSLYGTDHRVEGCTFRDKRNIGTLMVVWLEEDVTPRHAIVANHFERPVTLCDGNGKAINGQETIRIGTSTYSMQEAACTVEDNYFYHCHGEQAEIVSNKSCGNTYRRNFFVECQGTLTMRHGNNCTVTGNYFVGNGMSGTGGIRLIGEGHTVEHNYLEGLAGTGYRSAICLVRGQENPALSGYWQVKNAKVRYNMVYDCKYGLNVNYASSSSNQVVPVVSTVIEGNTVSATSSGYAVDCATEPAAPEIEWNDNKLYGRQRGVSLPSLTSAPAKPNVQPAMNAIREAAGCSWKTE